MSSPMKYRAPASLTPGQQGICSLQRICRPMALGSRPQALPRWFCKSPYFFCLEDRRNWRAWYPRGSSLGEAELGLFLTPLPEESWHQHCMCHTLPGWSRDMSLQLWLQPVHL